MKETKYIAPWNELDVRSLNNTDVTRTLHAIYRGVPTAIANFEIKQKIRDIQLNKKGRRKKYVKPT